MNWYLLRGRRRVVPAEGWKWWLGVILCLHLVLDRRYQVVRPHSPNEIYAFFKDLAGFHILE